jgi:hypothetical protein
MTMPLVVADVTVQAQSNKKADLEAKKAGDLALAKIDLFVNDFIPSALNKLADFVLPTFTGYVQKAFSGFAPTSEPLDGSASTVNTGVVSWIGPADATGQTVFGYLITAAAGGALIASGRFPGAGVGLNTPLDVLDLVASFRLP